ncbi:MAG: glycosyltransferase family 39 protein [Anaerolineae bacterium]
MGVKRADLFRLALLIGVILLIALPTITYPLGRDQGEFATIGRGLLDGRVPYVDLWNPKPPAVFYIYAAAMALFGRTVPALRAIDLLIFPMIAVCLWWIGRRMANTRAGEWAVILFGVFYFSETFWTLTQNDGIVLLPMSLAAVAALKAADRSPRAWAWALICGALCGWVFWFKYPFLFFAAALVIGYLLMRGRVFPAALAFAGGFALTAGGGALVMIAIGAWDALIESARVTTGYTALGFNWDEFQRGFSVALGTRAEHWGLLLALAAILPLMIVFRRARHTHQSPENVGETKPRGWAILNCWFIAGAAILLVQAKGYDYHWLPLLPPLTWYAAVAVDRLLTFLSSRLSSPIRPQSAPIGRRGAAVASTPATAAVVPVAAAALFLAIPVITIWGRALPYLSGQEDQATYFSHFQAGEFVADESLRAAEYLRAHVVAGDSLFIWGFRPEIYYMSGLNPAVRFIFQYPLVASWYPVEWRQQTVDILWAAMPPYVLVLQVDYLDWVTGRTLADSNTLLQEYTELNNWLIANYEHDTQIGNIFVWHRKVG